MDGTELLTLAAGVGASFTSFFVGLRVCGHGQREGCGGRNQDAAGGRNLATFHH